MAEKDVFITCEVLYLFWDCLGEDILYNEFQEHIENDLEAVSKLEKRAILVNCFSFVAYFAKNFVRFPLLSFSLFSKF